MSVGVAGNLADLDRGRSDRTTRRSPSWTTAKYCVPGAGESAEQWRPAARIEHDTDPVDRGPRALRSFQAQPHAARPRAPGLRLRELLCPVGGCGENACLRSPGSGASFETSAPRRFRRGAPSGNRAVRGQSAIRKHPPLAADDTQRSSKGAVVASEGPFAGVDWPTEEHAACVADERGRIVEGRLG